MTLPTVKPFDYPDWGAPGTLTASSYNIASVVSVGGVIASLNIGYYNHTLLIFDGNGDGEDYSVFLEWYTANPLEGGTLQITQFVTVAFQCIVVLPLTNPTPFLVIRDAGATAPDHNVLLTVTQFAAWGSMVGYPGGETVLFLMTGTSGPETLVWNMAGCAPGRHMAQITTDNPTWDLYVRYWYDWLNTVDVLIADETTPQPFAIEWIAPATSWQLVFVSGDAGDWDVSPIVTRLPT